MNKRLHAG